MQKLEIYAELFLRWIVLLICLPFTVIFFLLYTLGLAAEYFFTWVIGFTKTTRNIIANIDQPQINEHKTTA
jgi:hypothetical protein